MAQCSSGKGQLVIRNLSQGGRQSYDIRPTFCVINPRLPLLHVSKYSAAIYTANISGSAGVKWEVKEARLLATDGDPCAGRGQCNNTSFQEAARALLYPSASQMECSCLRYFDASF